ncbi:MAG: hypothetical protein NTU79_18160 [Planctomycetota bacterium]|nr:hypothetical protein [Planctomycetota bacterium]
MNNDPMLHDDSGEWEISGDREISSDLQNSIEAKVRSASSYVIPSDNLRPLTLQAARDYCSDKRSNRMLFKMTLGVAVCCCVVLPMLEKASSFGGSLATPSQDELEERAIKIAHERNVGIDWGLHEAFVQMRHEQAIRLGQAIQQDLSQ